VAWWDVQAVGGAWAVGAALNDDGQPSIFRINVDLQDLGTLSPYRMAVLVTIGFTESDDQGLPTPQTSAGLDDVAERVVNRLRTDATGVLTGLITTPGVGRTFCLYVASFDGFPQCFGSQLPPYRGRTVNVRSGNDPEWTVYRGQLAAARSGQSDIMLLDDLRNRGVDVSRPTHQEHYLLFPSVEAATQAVDVLPDGEFEISHPVEAKGNGWTVIVALNDSLDPLSLAHWRAQFTGLSRDFGGTYDGWGVPTGEVG
jgi:hypothetical protein